jgi:mono/diheme cytochrome c family protein
VAFFLAMSPMLLLIAAGCDDMKNQPRYEPLEESHFFSNGQSSRPPVPGTVAQGELRIDDAKYQGRVDGQVVDTFPFEITMSDMQRGKERYDIFCAICHGPAGQGNGMIVQRGLTPPPSLHLDRLRDAPVGHFYEVMTNGYGAMYSYASRIQVEDRWRIAAYVRALQLSQHAPLDMASATTQPTGEAAQ